MVKNQLKNYNAIICRYSKIVHMWSPDQEEFKVKHKNKYEDFLKSSQET